MPPLQTVVPTVLLYAQQEHESTTNETRPISPSKINLHFHHFLRISNLGRVWVFQPETFLNFFFFFLLFPNYKKGNNNEEHHSRIIHISDPGTIDVTSEVFETAEIFERQGSCTLKNLETDLSTHIDTDIDFMEQYHLERQGVCLSNYFMKH